MRGGSGGRVLKQRQPPGVEDEQEEHEFPLVPIMNAATIMRSRKNKHELDAPLARQVGVNPFRTRTLLAFGKMS